MIVENVGLSSSLSMKNLVFYYSYNSRYNMIVCTQSNLFSSHVLIHRCHQNNGLHHFMIEATSLYHVDTSHTLSLLVTAELKL